MTELKGNSRRVCSTPLNILTKIRMVKNSYKKSNEFSEITL